MTLHPLVTLHLWVVFFHDDDGSRENSDKQKAFEASAATAATMVLAIILSAFDRLEVLYLTTFPLT